MNFYDPERKPKDWLLRQDGPPSQIFLLVDSIIWTRSTQDILFDNPENLNQWYDVNVQGLEELTNLIRGELTPVQRRTLVAMVTQDVHFRDIVQKLRDDEVDSPDDFKWQQQLRFYHIENSCQAHQVNAVQHYGYEYLGATTRLVITPLTDRCWMTITGALHIKLGAAPAGPAGTGKTESTKDLAKSLGKLCIVFNCSEQITVAMMHKLFSGLAMTGAWSCLDEFNRIDIEVLSVIAQQVMIIRNALKAQMPDFEFFGNHIQLDPTMGIFITMNPGYAGRTELPDNLKVSFRPVSMMVPDYSLIAEVMLFAEGFSNAKDLSKKMTKLYQLSSEQLSQQHHYDFGMRAVKSVLVMAGALKRANPKLDEDIVLIRAMRDSNIPKFLSFDVPLFNAIVSDLFPEAKIPKSENPELEAEVLEVIDNRKLQPTPNFITKVLQFYETLKVRFGVMLVGPTMSGKSSVLYTLKDSITNLKLKGSTNPEWEKVEISTLNPKCISLPELYGNYDSTTQEWTDGLASTIMRSYVSDESSSLKWVMFDGPVDALWIENMNTVLDDNMMLCLPNGERIKLKPKMRMLFEVQDLAVASPATVSRCGMVYVDQDVVGLDAIIENYCQTILKTEIEPKQYEFIRKNLNLTLIKTIQQIRKFFHEPITTTDNNLVYNVILMIKIIFQTSKIGWSSFSDEQYKKVCDRLYAFAFTWGVSSALDAVSIIKFETYLSSLFSPNDLPRGSIYDSYLAFRNKPDGEWVPWSDDIQKFEFDKTKSYFDLVVQTKDTVRYSWLLKNNIEYLNSVFFTGVTGIGKTIIMQAALGEMKNENKIIPVGVVFSAKTTSKETQFAIENNLFAQRKGGKTFLVPTIPSQKLVVFIDDINMPATEKYGAQPPIELLRLIQDKRGVYDRKQLNWKAIENTVLVAAAAPPGGGRSELTPRFTRHFYMICIPPTPEDSLKLIFGEILKGFLEAYPFKTDLVNMADQVVGATLDIYQKISAELLPTPMKSHYTFNLRDVSKVFQGMLMGQPAQINKPEILIKLWIHEASRVFMDRLVSDEDRFWFQDNLVKLLFLYFKLDWKLEDVFVNNSIIFADFLVKGAELDQRVYEEVRDFENLKKIIADYMYDEGASMNLELVLFKDAVEHMCRVARVLRQPRGHVMLVGLGGSGKKSIAKMGAILAGSEVRMIETKKNYGKRQFREDMVQFFFFAAGKEGKPTTFLFPDTSIIEEDFLEDVNNLLNSGEIPNIFTKEDKDRIVQEMQEVMKAKGVINEPYAFFIERVRSNFHVVLAMSPVGDKLRNRMRMFPSLVNCCTIDWVKPWPHDALLSVAKMFLENIVHEA